MIIKYKIFEKLNSGKPKIGYYVLVNRHDLSGEINTFLNTNVGQISAIKYSLSSPIYYVSYSDAGKFKNYLTFNEKPLRGINEPTIEVKDEENIKLWSVNKIDIESYLKARSFDL